MKPACGILLIAFLLSFRIAWGQKETNSVLEKKITLEVQNEPITSILNKISEQTQVFFSYDATLIEADKKMNLSVSDKTIQESLDTLFDFKFIYKTIGDQIIISLPESDEVKKKEIGLINTEPRIITFSGRVFDREQRDVLPYTSISVLRSNIGILSNTDGDFELKIPENMKQDTVIISCLGYRQ